VILSTEGATVLFTDMVGSTALASALAPDVADELRREHFSILRQAIAEAGGTLSHFSQELSEVASDDQAELSTSWWRRR